MKFNSILPRFAACLLLCVAAPATYASPAASDAKASMESMQIPSHGSPMNALVYVAAGAGPHPVVILLHGFPGNERNLDLAQDMRRAGWDVLYFNYRGSWGTPGDFSFSHSVEDVASAIAYLRQPENAKRLRVDPSRIVLVGHSMGGFMAVQGAAADPAIKGIATISAADFSAMFAQMQAKGTAESAVKNMATGLAKEGMAPLSGCTPESLARDVASHASTWGFVSKVPAIHDRPTFVITSDDGLAAANDAFAVALQKAGDAKVTTLHLPTDHAYSDQREALSTALLKWLSAFE